MTTYTTFKTEFIIIYFLMVPPPCHHFKTKLSLWPSYKITFPCSCSISSIMIYLKGLHHDSSPTLFLPVYHCSGSKAGKRAGP